MLEVAHMASPIHSLNVTMVYLIRFWCWDTRPGLRTFLNGNDIPNKGLLV